MEPVKVMVEWTKKLMLNTALLHGDNLPLVTRALY